MALYQRDNVKKYGSGTLAYAAYGTVFRYTK
jgi:hypothetical protein